MQYAEKELLVFKAFKNILFSDSDITKITVSEIAKEAGIGKGTVYEYFDSKEEIIAKSLVYNFYEEINTLSSQIDQNLSFKENCYILFDFLINRLMTISPYFKLLSSNFKIKDFCDNLKGCSIIDDIKKELNSLTFKIISIGMNEGAISENCDKDYQAFVMRSACSGLANSVHISKSKDLDVYKNYTYNFIEKALK